MIAIDIICRVITRFSPSVLAAFLFIVPFCVHAQTFSLPVSRLNALNVDWAVADLDGDQKSDLALAQVLEHERGYRISLRLSATGDSSYFDLPSGIRSGLTVRAQDVDGDHDLDLVITSGLSRQPVGIWLNDGVGNFTQGDASLYAEWIWRGPPILFSRSTSADRQSACPEESRSTLSLVTASVSLGLFAAFASSSPRSH